MYCSRSSAPAARAAPPMDASRTKLHHDQAFVHGDSPIGTNGMKVNILPWLLRSLAGRFLNPASVPPV